MDSTIPVQDTNFSGNRKELTKVLGADEETNSHLYWQFFGNWQVLRGIILESLYVNTTRIRNKWWIAERAVRRVKEGTLVVLLQSGLDNAWWADSIECYCYRRNIQDLLSDGKTPYERLFGIAFNGPVIPFGAMVEYHPISAKDLSRLHQFGPKVLPGIFLGYLLHAGGIWKGDILVADIEDLEQMDASEIYAKRLKAKEVLSPMSGEKFIFPIADGTVKLSGEDQVLRTSTLIRDSPDRGEEIENLLRESDGSPPQDSSPSDGEARNDFWPISGNYIYRHHVDPGVKLYVPREQSFPIPLRCIDVTRATSTTLDVMLERRMYEYWNFEGDRDLSDAWTGFTRFTIPNEEPSDGYTWSGRELIKRDRKNMSDAAQRKKKQKWTIEKTEAWQHLLHWSSGCGVQGDYEKCA